MLINGNDTEKHENTLTEDLSKGKTKNFLEEVNGDNLKHKNEQICG